MASVTFDDQLTTKVAPDRLFRAAVTNWHILAPQLVPFIVKDAKVLEGEVGAGAIRQFNFTDAVPYKFVKERIDVYDQAKYEYAYTMLEGGNLGTKLESVSYQFKLVPSADGGCTCKMTANYKTLPGVEYKEEDIQKETKETMAMFHGVEQYLLGNPEAFTT